MIEGHEIKKIYDEYKQVVFKVAYKYSRNSEVANDIAHDVCTDPQKLDLKI